MQFDAVVIGGSYSGLAAALQLGRARRRVLVVDAGERRNRFAGHSHGFLTRDGTEASEIARIGREQVMAYETMGWADDRARSAERVPGGFRIDLEEAGEVTTRRLVLAHGVRDHLPDVPGLAERWGRSVFHCPYCHGYELNQDRLGFLATSPMAMHMAMLLPDWGPTTLFLNDAFMPDDGQLAALERRGVELVAGAVVEVTGEADVRVADGGVHQLAGLFVGTKIEVSTPIAEQLGCEFDDGPFGRTIKVEIMKQTSVPGVFACGDAARPGGSLPLAVGDGTLAGAAAHQSLIFLDLD